MTAKYVVNAAGVYADVFHNMVSEKKIHITPRKGDYCLLDKEAGSHVSHTIFQLPGKMGKGILVTPTVHGNLLTGPTAKDIEDKEAVATTAWIGRGDEQSGTRREGRSLPPGDHFLCRAAGPRGQRRLCDRGSRGCARIFRRRGNRVPGTYQRAGYRALCGGAGGGEIRRAAESGLERPQDRNCAAK